jgi:hypothetical protein
MTVAAPKTLRVLWKNIQTFSNKKSRREQRLLLAYQVLHVTLVFGADEL